MFYLKMRQKWKKTGIKDIEIICIDGYIQHGKQFFPFVKHSLSRHIGIPSAFDIIY